MRKFVFASIVWVVSISPAFAGAESQMTQSKADEKVPLDIVDAESGYVFESDLNHGGSFGKQDELQNEISYAHRFLLSGDLYLRTGVGYKRFDFGRTNAPVPLHLQSFAGIISVDYMHGSDIGALIEFEPGIYTENDVRWEAFDCPITIARFFVLQPEKLYVMIGVRASLLRGGSGVLPLPGLVWIPNNKVRLMAILPEPRVIYSVSDKLDFYIGGEFEGGAFRTDHKNLVGPHVAKLSGTQVDYADYRAGAGLTYDLTHAISLDAGGGYAIERAFLFHRAGENYRTDPAPYLKIELKGKF